MSRGPKRACQWEPEKDNKRVKLNNNNDQQSQVPHDMSLSDICHALKVKESTTKEFLVPSNNVGNSDQNVKHE